MSYNTLSPLDGRYATTLNPLSALFSEHALMQYRLSVEVHWLKHLSQQSPIANIPTLSSSAEKALLALSSTFDEKDMMRIKQIEENTHHDVKAVEYFLREKIEKIDGLKHLSPWIHFGATSEDINNLAYALMIQNAIKQEIIPSLQTLYQTLKTIAHTYQKVPMLARTHGQPASPTTFGKEIAVFAWRLYKAMQSLQTWQADGKFNGAVGNFNAHHITFPDVDWCSLSAQMVSDLGLAWQPLSTQIEAHDGIANLCHTLIEIHCILLDLSKDMWHYISLHYLQQKKIHKDQVGSSTMPHKINPIQFENAEGNFGLSNALLSFMAQKLPQSRLQRDLSDSTVMRNIGSALGYARLAYQNLNKGLLSIHCNQAKMEDDLNNHWEVLSEAAQTLLRAEGKSNAYETLKSMSQGQTFNAFDWQKWLEEQNFASPLREKLQALKPNNYLGLSAELLRFLPEIN